MGKTQSLQVGEEFEAYVERYADDRRTEDEVARQLLWCAGKGLELDSTGYSQEIPG